MVGCVPFIPRAVICQLTFVCASAEQQLKLARTHPGHHMEVLRIVAASEPALASVPPAVRQAAAVHFKNVVKKGWSNEEDADHEGIVITETDRQTIKTHLVQLMCSTPAQIQSQLSESISLIANSDYPNQWLNLLPELIQHFTATTDGSTLVGVLKTANGIFKRFRHVERSDDLYRVIIYTLNLLQAPLLDLAKSVSQAIDAATTAKDQAATQNMLEALRLICRIFYSLNFQDLPEYFEDHMEEWMVIFAKFLQYANSDVEDDSNETEPSVVDRVQTAIIENLHLYASKDEEVFVDTYLSQFVGLVWRRLIQVTTYPKHDSLATTSMKFLSSLIEKPLHRALFSEPDTLRQLFTNIVIPNIRFRDSDEELFEDSPHDYILTEVEGLEHESRRYWALEFLKAMNRQFLTETTDICATQLQPMLLEYSQSPATQWVAKDAAVSMNNEGHC
jgi:exportin-2 (importin alpha re-exporter)